MRNIEKECKTLVDIYGRVHPIYLCETLLNVYMHVHPIYCCCLEYLYDNALVKTAHERALAAVEESNLLQAQYGGKEEEEEHDEEET